MNFTIQMLTIMITISNNPTLTIIQFLILIPTSLTLLNTITIISSNMIILSISFIGYKLNILYPELKKQSINFKFSRINM